MEIKYTDNFVFYMVIDDDGFAEYINENPDGTYSLCDDSDSNILLNQREELAKSSRSYSQIRLDMENFVKEKLDLPF